MSLRLDGERWVTREEEEFARAPNAPDPLLVALPLLQTITPLGTFALRRPGQSTKDSVCSLASSEPQPRTVRLRPAPEPGSAGPARSRLMASEATASHRPPAGHGRALPPWSCSRRARTHPWP